MWRWLVTVSFVVMLGIFYIPATMMKIQAPSKEPVTNFYAPEPPSPPPPEEPTEAVPMAPEKTYHVDPLITPIEVEKKNYDIYINPAPPVTAETWIKSISNSIKEIISLITALYTFYMWMTHFKKKRRVAHAR